MDKGYTLFALCSNVKRVFIKSHINIEHFWRSLKYEKIYLEPSEDGIELCCKVKWYIDFYNTRRLHQSLGYDKPERVITRVA